MSVGHVPRSDKLFALTSVSYGSMSVLPVESIEKDSGVCHTPTKGCEEDLLRASLAHLGMMSVFVTSEKRHLGGHYAIFADTTAVYFNRSEYAFDEKTFPFV